MTLRTAKDRFLARRVILTAPRPVLAGIRFTPQLPPALRNFLQRQPIGAVTKVNAIYDRPFSREQGLNGSVVSDTGPVEIAYDNSPPDGQPRVLVGFIEANQSRQLFYATPAERRQAALASFARYFSDAALNPTDYVDIVWTQERYTLGAYGSYNPPAC